MDGWPNCTLYEFVTGLFSKSSHILYKQIEKHDYGCISKIVFQHYAQEREITMKEFYSTNKSRTSSTLVLECNEILPF